MSRSLFKMVPRLVSIAGAVTAVIGIVLLLMSLYDVYGHRWTPVQARVTNAQRDTVNVFARAGSSPTRYEPRIRFAYEVDGREYRSDRVYAGPTEQWADYAELDRFMDDAGYERNRTVTAYHDAADPTRAVLIVGGDHSGRIIVIIIGLMIMGFGWIMKKDDEAAANMGR